MIIKSGYQTSVFLKSLGMCESSTCVYACVNHSSRFAEISPNPHKKSKFSPLLCCAKQKTKKAKVDSTPCIGRTGEVWENNLRSISRLLLMVSTSSSSQLCLSGGWTGLYSLHKQCALQILLQIYSPHSLTSSSFSRSPKNDLLPKIFSYSQTKGPFSTAELEGMFNEVEIVISTRGSSPLNTCRPTGASRLAESKRN